MIREPPGNMGVSCDDREECVHLRAYLPLIRFRPVVPVRGRLAYRKTNGFTASSDSGDRSFAAIFTGQSSSGLLDHIH